MAVLDLSALSFSLAHLVGGNGFIVAFCAGLTLGNLSRPICAGLYEFVEAEGQLLTLIVFMVLGAVLLPESVAFFDGTSLLYAALRLTVVQGLPVALSLVGTRLHLSTVSFLGWFGLRGLASVLFALLVLENALLSDREAIWGVAMMTVSLSVSAHGLTAFPEVYWYSKQMGKGGRTVHREVGEMPVRFPLK